MNTFQTLQYILKYIANNSKVIANKGNTACLDQSSINDIFQEISQFWIQVFVIVTIVTLDTKNKKVFFSTYSDKIVISEIDYHS